MAPFVPWWLVLSRAFVESMWIDLVHLVLVLTWCPLLLLRGYPLPYSLPPLGFLLKMGRWRSAASPSIGPPSRRGSACLQRVHSTVSDNFGVVGSTGSVVCGSVSRLFRLDSATRVMVERFQRARVGRRRPFEWKGSVRNTGAPGGLAQTMVSASTVISLKFVRRAQAVRRLCLAEPMRLGQVDGIGRPVSLGVEGSAATLTVLAFAA